MNTIKRTLLIFLIAQSLFSFSQVPGNDRATINLDAKIFDTYVGQYELRPGFILTIRREGEKFISQASGQPTFEIFPRTETRFFLKAFDAELEFTSDAQGTVNGVTLHQGGNVIPAKKISNEIPKPRTAITLDSALLEQYTGEYDLAPGFIITISSESNKLMVQATGQPPFEFFPESETKFFSKDIDAQIEFIKDDSGEVKSLTLYQGGTMQGKKIK